MCNHIVICCHCCSKPSFRERPRKRRQRIRPQLHSRPQAELQWFEDSINDIVKIVSEEVSMAAVAVRDLFRPASVRPK